MRGTSMQFPQIDILRGFAALSVVVYHVIELMSWTAFPFIWPLAWFRVGWMGVDLFFVISGFVIALSAFTEIQKNGVFRKVFASRRLARITPLHYAACTIFILLVQPAIIFKNDVITDIGVHLIFVHNLFYSYSGSINGANWSLGVEMQFYLLVLLFAPILRKAPWWGVAATFVGVAWGWRYYAFLTTDINGPNGAFPTFWKATQIPGTLDEFAVGILLARMVSSDRGKKWLDIGKRVPWAPVCLAGVAMSAALTFFWLYDPAYWDSVIMVVFFRTLLAVSFGCVVFAACCLRVDGVMALTTAPMRYLGVISYGIYLWHLPVILSLQRLPWLTAPRALPYVLALTCVLAAGSWHFFEKPFMDRAKAKQRVREKRVQLDVLPKDKSCDAKTLGNVDKVIGCESVA